MASDVVAPGSDDTGDDRPSGKGGSPTQGRPGAPGGFFTIYKKGQGYWTRMGTVIACSVLGLMLAYTLYDKVPAFFLESRTSSIDVKSPTTAAEASSLFADAQKDIAAAHYSDARVRLDRVIGARNAAGIPAEVVGQAEFARKNLPEAATRARKIGIITALIFLAIYVPIVAHLVNRPSNVDFLIATDSEMKKVNWTSRRELIGSTKVVIVFMFFIAILLFVIDILFGYLMHWIGVLIHSPYITIGGG